MTTDSETERGTETAIIRTGTGTGTGGARRTGNDPVIGMTETDGAAGTL